MTYFSFSYTSCMTYNTAVKGAGDMASERDILRRLDDRRRELGMSHESLGARAGVAPRTVQRALNGEATPRLSTVVAMARVLGEEISVRTSCSADALRGAEARRKARALAGLAQGNSALEAQAVGSRARRSAERSVEARLLAGSPGKLWAI